MKQYLLECALGSNIIINTVHFGLFFQKHPCFYNCSYIIIIIAKFIVNEPCEINFVSSNTVVSIKQGHSSIIQLKL